MRQRRHWASRRCAMSPARSRTRRCLETAGILILNGLASSPTEHSFESRRARMALRVGSASAAKVTLNRSAGMCLTSRLINLLVLYNGRARLSTLLWWGRRFRLWGLPFWRAGNLARSRLFSRLPGERSSPTAGLETPPAGLDACPTCRDLLQ